MYKQQIKLFIGKTYKSGELEEKVNYWLSDTRHGINNIETKVSGDNITIVIYYTKKVEE